MAVAVATGVIAGGWYGFMKRLGSSLRQAASRG
jgi:hypothetical protein